MGSAKWRTEFCSRFKKNCNICTWDKVLIHLLKHRSFISFSVSWGVLLHFHSLVEKDANSYVIGTRLAGCIGGLRISGSSRQREKKTSPICLNCCIDLVNTALKIWELFCWLDGRCLFFQKVLKFWHLNLDLSYVKYVRIEPVFCEYLLVWGSWGHKFKEALYFTYHQDLRSCDSEILYKCIP